MKRESSILDEVKNQLIDFELETGWYNKLIDQSSTNLNNADHSSQIKREYNVDYSTYRVIVDLQKSTVSFFSQSFLKSSDLKEELTIKFEKGSKQLFYALTGLVEKLTKNQPLDLRIGSGEQVVKFV